MGNVYLYSRVSSDRQTSGRGLDRQAELLTSWALAHGHTISPLDLSDAGKSAFKGAHLRGALGRFIQMAEAGQLAPDPILLIEELDRLSRLGTLDAVQQVLLRLINAEVSIYDWGERRLLNRQTLNAERGLLASVVDDLEAANRYSARLSRRVADSHAARRQRIAAGQPARVGPLPAWVTQADDGGLLLNAHADVVRQMFVWSEHGHGGTAIARLLNADGHRNSRGGLWTGAAVDRVMARPSVYGTLVLADKNEIPGYYPAAVTEMQYRAAAHRRKTGARRGFTRGPNQHWIGAGISKCHHCQGSITINSGTQRDGSRTYYVRCIRPGCAGAGGWPLNCVTQHLLWCLTGPLQSRILQPPPPPDDNAITAAQADIDAAQVALSAAQAKVEQAVFDPELDLATVKLLQSAVSGARERLGAAQATRDALMARRPSETIPEPSLGTPDGRREFNLGLRRLGLRLQFDRPTQRIGIELHQRTTWTELGDFFAANAIGPSGAFEVERGDAQPPDFTPDEQRYWDQVDAESIRAQYRDRLPSPKSAPPDPPAGRPE
jgi:DNA invertase Pin-like site-specific DNA recombinase